MSNNIEEIKKLPLKEILASKYGMKFNNAGFALCPFHNDTEPSMKVSQDTQGYWRWHCFACNIGGDYIDFRMKKDNTDFVNTIKIIQLENSLKPESEVLKKIEPKKPVAIYIYKDEEGKPLYQKIKFDSNTYRVERWEDDQWKAGLNGTRRALFNMPELIKSPYVFYLEGEKDCETLKELGHVATTAGSVNSWNQDFAKYFKDKKVTICLDVGNEQIAEKIANDLSGFTKHIKILNLPGLNEREQDITDWFEMMENISNEEKKSRLEKVIEKTPIYEQRKETKVPQIENLRDFMEREIPTREVFLENWIERKALTILGGEQKVGKSIIALNIAKSLAIGRNFLGFKVLKPRKVLLIQQEISDSAMKERITKMLKKEDSPLLDENFLIKNTTGSLLKITKPEDRKQLFKEIEEYKPDLIIFDPLSTFHDKKENDEKEMAEVFDYFFEIVHKFKVAILVIHHYGKPAIAQRQGSHLLRGHSIIGDRADAIIVFNKLPERYKNTQLPQPYNCYAEIQFILRNDAAPDNIIVERDSEDLWYRPYDLYGNLGRKILPEKIKKIIEENGGGMLQKELIEILLEQASRTVIFKAIHEAKEKEYIEDEIIPGRGNPVSLKLKTKENF